MVNPINMQRVMIEWLLLIRRAILFLSCIGILLNLFLRYRGLLIPSHFVQLPKFREPAYGFQNFGGYPRRLTLGVVQNILLPLREHLLDLGLGDLEVQRLPRSRLRHPAGGGGLLSG